MNWTFEMTMYLVFAAAIFIALAAIFRLADKLGIAEFERDVANYELKKLREYRKATGLNLD